MYSIIIYICIVYIYKKKENFSFLRTFSGCLASLMSWLRKGTVPWIYIGEQIRESEDRDGNWIHLTFEEQRDEVTVGDYVEEEGLCRQEGWGSNWWRISQKILSRNNSGECFQKGPTGVVTPCEKKREDLWLVNMRYKEWTLDGMH